MGYYENIPLEKELLMKRSFSRYEKHDMHVHELLEICVILENKARYLFNDLEYEALPGDIFICRPFEQHWIFSEHESVPCQYILIYFSPAIVRSIPSGYTLLAPFYCYGTLPAKIPAASPFAKEAFLAAHQALLESEKQGIAWETKQYIHFITLLTHIYEYANELQPFSGEELMEGGIIRAIGAIIANITNKIDMNEVIRATGLGKTMFYRKFKQMTQLSPNHFMNKLRLQLAAHTLSTSNKPVIDIAMESGYASLSAFNKQFQSHFGMSPRSYRKQER
ncbi:AraC family transcriptional regulator [Paenibacillus terrigena]|uniref:helix-turn-helix transcriptional regulator n=1 Tax=Paenibacillus terrigena TaxID=369333 RepID=UPI0028D76B9C|nr:AraC family transcriptional regulator [Paenibacillus terrigena]